MRGRHLTHYRPHKLRVPHVDRYRACLSASRDDLRRCRLHALQFPARQHDMGAELRQQVGDAAADAAATTGDQGNLAVKEAGAEDRRWGGRRHARVRVEEGELGKEVHTTDWSTEYSVANAVQVHMLRQRCSGTRTGLATDYSVLPVCFSYCGATDSASASPIASASTVASSSGANESASESWLTGPNDRR